MPGQGVVPTDPNRNSTCQKSPALTSARGLLAALLAACAISATAQTPPSAIVIGMGPVARHLNSAVQSGIATGIPATQIFASPLRFDKDWTPQPYLAENWLFQDNGKSLLLKLVPGATFHDGKPITSEDVAFSIMAIKANHPFQSMFEPVERVDTPTPQIAIIRLKQPYPAILLALSPAFCPIIPKHIFGDGQNLQTHPRNVNPVGSGPFKVVAFNPREAIVLEHYAGFQRLVVSDAPVLFTHVWAQGYAVDLGASGTL